MLIGHLYICFRDMFIQKLYSFLNWIIFILLRSKNALYMLRTHLLSGIWFADILSGFWVIYLLDSVLLMNISVLGRITSYI